MSGRIGRSVAFTWNSAAVNGVREKGVAANGAPINVGSDENSGWQTLLEAAGENSVTISLSGVTKSTALRDDWFAGTRTRAVSLAFPDGSTITGNFMIASYTENEPYNDASTFECELQSASAITCTPAAAPSNSVLPAISGIAQEGVTLTALPGTWSGGPTAYTYQWQSNDGGWGNISGATSATYVVQSGDVGNNLRCVVTATNAAGSDSATSAATDTVIAASS